MMKRHALIVVLALIVLGLAQGAQASTSASYSVWASWDGTTSEMLFNTGAAGLGGGPDLYLSTSNMFSWNTYDGDTNKFTSTPNLSTMADGSLHNYVVVADGTMNTVYLYFDGGLVGTATYVTPGTLFAVGSAGDSPGTYVWTTSSAHPTITSQKFDNYALTASEVTTLYQNGSVPIPGAVWLLGSGLVCLIGLKRKYLG
jgi:hypothetical protein